jgi:glycerol-3-phosphate dehydrogenase (NAD(P)+)
MKNVGVIGTGSFGTAVANLLAENNQVLLYTRRKEKLDAINISREFRGQKLHANITLTNSAEELSTKCQLIFPIVPSASFRSMMKTFSPFLHPGHILIHGTKGLDIVLPENTEFKESTLLSRENIRTMSEVILEESVVIRVGYMGGPNIAKEIMMGKPAAAVIASKFEEVINEGVKSIRSNLFQVYGSNDIVGIELAGIFKNIIAIASGAISANELGENARGVLISRGTAEIARLARHLGANPQSFLGVAGIGDLVATCSSSNSRNYTVGYRLAKGEKLNDIISSMNEVAEGVNTVRIAYALAKKYDVICPISTTLYKILFQDISVEEGLKYLMSFRFFKDVDFI